ncbi:MAG: aspartate aminotransferase family protein [Pirellulaceae bacterium]|nr:aspartate aminotransferase family protein [Pirellulaceae bacterium]
MDSYRKHPVPNAASSCEPLSLATGCSLSTEPAAIAVPFTEDAIHDASPRGVRRPYDPNDALQFVRGEGVYLWDVDNRRYIDFVSGYSSTIFGHSHPRLVNAAIDQLSILTQLVGLRHPWRQKLESGLAELAPMTSPVKVWLTTTGARAVEVAWKIAYAARPGRLVAFDLGFHGRSLATAEISDTAKLPILPTATDRLPYPRCQSCPVGLHPKSCNAECFEPSAEWIDKNADELSAIIVEPAIGARGYFYAPSVFFQRLHQVARRNGILLIDDEIQMGLGRLGGVFAAQTQGWEPDLAILGKSLGGGIVPIAAVLGNALLMDKLPEGYESETFAGNPLACRIAVEAVDLLRNDCLLDRIPMIESWIAKGMTCLQKSSKQSILVDWKGASGVLEIVDDTSSRNSPTSRNKVAASTIARDWVTKARDLGLLVHLTGPKRNRIAIIPPLIADESNFQQAFKILELATSAAQARSLRH